MEKTVIFLLPGFTGFSVSALKTSMFCRNWDDSPGVDQTVFFHLKIGENTFFFKKLYDTLATSRLPKRGI